MNKITKDDRLKLLGLLALARCFSKQMVECERAMGNIVGCLDDSGYAGHFSDAVWDDDPLDGAINKALKYTKANEERAKKNI